MFRVERVGLPLLRTTRTGLRWTTIVYLWTSFVTILLLTFLTPPFQVPDEQQHFFRAYQISILELRATASNGMAGGFLPSSLSEIAERFLGSRELHVWRRKIRPSPLIETLQAADQPLDPGRQEFTNFFGSAFYSPAPYVAQAAAIAVGRAAGLGPLWLLFLARITTGIAAALVVAAALQLFPSTALTLMVFALLPMTLYEFASVSTDPSVIAAALFFTALALRARSLGRWRGWEVGAACVAGIVFCSVKPVYAPLLVLGLPFGLSKGSRFNTVGAYAAIVSAALGGTALWLFYAKPVLVPSFPNTNPEEQITHIVAQPLSFMMMLARSTHFYLGQWTREMIGVLGWLNVYMPLPMYLIPAGALAICVTIRQGVEKPLSVYEGAWYIFVALSCVLLTMLALYLYWNQVGAQGLVGMQGRYFLPLAGVMAVLLQGRVPLLCGVWADRSQWIVVTAVVIEAALTAGFVAVKWGTQYLMAWYNVF